jgi:hypothetical protein
MVKLRKTNQILLNYNNMCEKMPRILRITEYYTFETVVLCIWASEASTNAQSLAQILTSTLALYV